METLCGSQTGLPARGFTLRDKLMTVLLAMTVIILALLGIYYYTVREALINEGNQKLYAAVSHTAANVDAFIETNLNAIHAASQLPALADYLQMSPQERAGSATESLAMDILAVLPQPWDQYNTVSYALLDTNGVNVIDTMRANIGDQEGDRDYFQTPYSTGQPYVSPVEFSPAVGGVYLYFSAPVRRDYVGPVVGMLRMRFSISTVQNLLADNRGMAGKDSYAVLLDENLVRLADSERPEMLFKAAVPFEPERAEALRAERRLPNWPLEQLAAGSPDFARGIAGADGEPFFSSPIHDSDDPAYQVAATRLSRQPWTVAFVQPRDVFMAPINSQARRTLALGLVVAAGSILAAVLIAYWFTRPILRLTAVAEQIAAGDLSVKAQVESRDEIGVLAATFNNMTAQLRATLGTLEQRVAELAQANTSLERQIGEREQMQRERSYLAAVIEESQDIAVIKDLGLRIISANRSFLAAAGKATLADVVGQTDADLFEPDVAGRYMADERRTQTLAQGDVITSEEVLVFPNGKSRTLFIRRFPVFDERGTLIATAMTASDITQRTRAEAALREAYDLLELRVRERTYDLSVANAQLHQEVTERKQMEEALRQYTLQLEARNEELDAFAHTVAHDLQNPLGVVIGYAALLYDDVENMPAEQIRFGLSAINQSAEKMSRIIEELLLLAGVRKTHVELEPLDMGSIVREAQQRLVTMIEEHGAQITVPDEWPLAVGYGPWIEEVWANYINNAIKYGGEPPCVELGATAQPDGTVRFWVRDNGAGLTEEEQTRLFTPFTRLDQVRARGYGLGLSIVRRIMDRLGGEVGVESRDGEGSIFSFVLPAADAWNGLSGEGHA